MRSSFLVSVAVCAAAVTVSASSLAQGYLPAQPDPYVAPPPVHQAPPPPPSAYAPNGEFVAPMAQQTQQTYVPQSVALSGPMRLSDWRDGEPIPPGYHPVHRARGGLIGGGLAMFGASYLFSVLGAAADASSTCYQTQYAGPGSSSSGCEHKFWPLWIPVGGPLIAIGTTHSDPLGTTVLVLDALVQGGGVLMAALGINGHTVLMRNDLGQKLELTPMMAMGQTHSGNGMGVRLTF